MRGSVASLIPFVQESASWLRSNRYQDPRIPEGERALSRSRVQGTQLWVKPRDPTCSFSLWKDIGAPRKTGLHNQQSAYAALSRRYLYHCVPICTYLSFTFSL